MASLSLHLEDRSAASHQQGPWGGSLGAKRHVKFPRYSCMKILHSGGLVIANDGGRGGTAWSCRPQHHRVISSSQTPGVHRSKLCQALCYLKVTGEGQVRVCGVLQTGGLNSEQSYEVWKRHRLSNTTSLQAVNIVQCWEGSASGGSFSSVPPRSLWYPE